MFFKIARFQRKGVARDSKKSRAEKATGTKKAVLKFNAAMSAVVTFHIQ